MTNDAGSKHIEDEEEMLGKERIEVEKTEREEKGNLKALNDPLRILKHNKFLWSISHRVDVLLFQ